MKRPSPIVGSISSPGTARRLPGALEMQRLLVKVAIFAGLVVGLVAGNPIEEAIAAAEGSIPFEIQVIPYENHIYLDRRGGYNSCRYIVIAEFDASEAYLYDRGDGQGPRPHITVVRPNLPAPTPIPVTELIPAQRWGDGFETGATYGEYPAYQPPSGKYAYVWYNGSNDFDSFFPPSGEPQPTYCIDTLAPFAASGQAPANAAARLGLYGQPGLDAAITVAPTDEDQVIAGDAFVVEATLTNSADEPLTDLALDEGIGLYSSGTLDILEGPDWDPPDELAPDGSVTIRWIASFDSVGPLRLEVRASARLDGAPVFDTASRDVRVAPPVDIVVQSGQGTSTEPGDEFEAAVAITNEWDKPVEAVKMSAFEGPPGGAVSVLSGPIDGAGNAPPADGYALAPGASIRLQYRMRLEADVYPAELTARVTGRDPETDAVFFLSATSVASSGLIVKVEAERDDDTIIVTTRVTNDSGEPVEDLGTSGLVVEQAEDLTNGGLLPNPLGTPDRRGRLPDTLGVGEEVEITTVFPVVSGGIAVLTETVAGSTADGPVGGEEIVSIEVTEDELTRLDAEEMALDGLRTSLRTIDETNKGIIKSFTDDLVVGGGKPVSPEIRATIDSWKAAGFSDEWATNLAVWEAERESFDERWAATWDGFTAQAERRGVEAKDGVAAFFGVITDWDKVEALGTDIYRGGVENLGYLGDVFGMMGPELLEVAIEGNLALGAKVKTDTELAWQGQKELWDLEEDAFLADPVAASRVVGNRQGGYMANGTIDASLAIFGEGAAVATSKLVAPILSRGLGLRSGMSSTRIVPDEAILSSADSIDDAAARLARLEQANRDSLQNLPSGTVIPLDADFGTRTGFSPDDAAQFQEITREMSEKYGINFVAQFRTAEPASISVPNVLGKEEWNAYKAVGPLDRAIGGPKLLEGQVSVFNPVPLSQEALDALEATTPGFTKTYADRFATQQKNYADWNAGKGQMNTIVAGSQRHGPIRIINGRPGNPTDGVTYLEQLDEPEFVASLGLSDSGLADLRSRLQHHPGLSRPTEVVALNIDDATTFARKMPDGTVRPYGSDYDLQYFGPADGVWPEGKRGQIITDFMARVGKTARVPAHGASDLGFDLDTQYFLKLAEYIMLPISPKAAGPKAAELFNRAKQVVRDLRLQADAVEAKHPARAAKMRENADKLDAVTEKQLEGYAKGEKTILITPGDIRVARGD